MNRAQRRRLQRERDNHPDAGRNTVEQNEVGNVGESSRKRLTKANREEDFAVFDQLHPALRQALNDARGKYSAIEVRTIWHGAREVGRTAADVGRAILKRDRELYS